MTKRIALAVLVTACLVSCKKRSGAPATPAGVRSVKVGAIQPLSGATAQYGKETVNGLKLAIEETNAAGDLHLDLKVVDNKSESNSSRSAAQKLVEIDGVQVIVGAVQSTNTMVAARYVQDQGIPMVTSASTNVKVTQLGDCIFRVCFVDSVQGGAAATFAFDHLKASRAAIVFDSASDYSMGLRDVFKETFSRLGGETVAEVSFVAGDKDFASLVLNVRKSEPSVVFLPAYYKEVGLIMKQAREKGLDVPFLGCDGWDNQKVYELAGKGMRNGYFTTHFSPEDPDPVVQQFVQKYEQRYKEAPGALAALGYDAGLAVADACRRAKSAKPSDIKEAMSVLEDLRGVSGTISLDENRNPVKAVVIMQTSEAGKKFLKRVLPE